MEKNSPKKPPKGEILYFPHVYVPCKMIAETEIHLFVMCTSSLTAAFIYYNAKYRRFMKENVANQNSTKTEGVNKTRIRL